MKQLVLALALLFATTANAQLVADPAYGVAHNPAELRLNYLPQDQAKPYVTVYGTGERFKQVVGWFYSNDELKRLKDASHFNAIDTQSVMFRDRYAATTPAKLTIRIQDADGDTLQEVTDGRIPMSAEAFIRQTNKSECFRRRQLQPAPPDLDPAPQPLPPPDYKPPVQRSPVWPGIVLVSVTSLTGAVLGVRRKWMESQLKG